MSVEWAIPETRYTRSVVLLFNADAFGRIEAVIAVSSPRKAEVAAVAWNSWSGFSAIRMGF